MKKGIIALVLLFCGMPIAGASEEYQSLAYLSMPDALVSRSEMQECNARAEMQLEDVQTLITCLEKSGYYVTGRRVANRLADYMQWWLQDYKSNPWAIADQKQAANIVQVIKISRPGLAAVMSRLADEQEAHPQLPDLLIQRPDSCEANVVKAAISASGLPLDYSVEDPLASFSDTTVKINANADGIVSCYFSRRDWNRVITLLTTSGSDASGNPSQEWHLAIAYDKLGNHHNARQHIRSAFQALSDSTPAALASQIKYDYNRLGVAKADAVAQARQKAAEARQKAEAAAEAAAEERAALASYNAELAALSPDEREVRENNGEPCHISTNDDAITGHWETWSYHCIGDGDSAVGREQFTFLNGKLYQHMQL